MQMHSDALTKRTTHARCGCGYQEVKRTLMREGNRVKSVGISYPPASPLNIGSG